MDEETSGSLRLIDERLAKSSLIFNLHDRQQGATMHSIWVNLFDPGNEAIKFESVYGYHIYHFDDRTLLCYWLRRPASGTCEIK
jgi:hypothetical protein